MVCPKVVFTVLLGALWQVFGEFVLPEHCYRFARGPSRALRNSANNDDGFEISVRRSYDGARVGAWFEPEKEYLVTLKNELPLVTFDDFLFWLTPTEPPMMDPSDGKYTTRDCTMSPGKCVGSWVHTLNRMGSRLPWQNRRRNRHAGQVLTRNRPGCRGLVVEGLHSFSGRYPPLIRQMGRIVLLWRSPNASRHNCVTLHAMVRTRTSVLKEVGGLMKTLCPTEMRPMEPVISRIRESLDVDRNDPTVYLQPPYANPMQTTLRDSVQPKDCCSCGTATYRLTFQGLWNRSTHPQDWPTKNPNLLHWTNLIGASHAPSFQIYAIGQTASAGVQSVCAYGDTTVLREALSLAAAKAEGAAGVPTGSQSATTDISPLRALIFTPGMWGEETLMERRTTLFSVNRTHPLFSMLTMLGPSPDWCTGISGQSLCKADCTWVRNMTLYLHPWDAGIREGNTYMPKESDRKEIPDPIRYIDESWMPGNPFRKKKPIALVKLERVLPKHDWECTNKDADGVQLFLMGGGIRVTGKKPSDGMDPGKRKDQMHSASATQQIVTGKGRGKSSKSVGFGGPGASGTLGTNNPLSDPSLAQMATFLCITSEWSGWSACSVTCGVGTKTRTRQLIANKKPELCQHVPLVMEESCEGRKRTCDYSAPCSFLPWTLWSPCSATCEHQVGTRSRTRALARPEEAEQCKHLWAGKEGGMESVMKEVEECRIPPEACEPATICGEGPKQGYPCGQKRRRFYYSAIDHECLEFEYLGCKGGRNMFETKEKCEKLCIPAVEALPAWRRERMGLLQFKTSQLAATSGDSKEEELKQDPACHYEVNTGYECDPPKQLGNYWYYCSRTNRCRDFFYLGCGGTPNRWANHTACMAACMPNELRQLQLLAKVRVATGSRRSDKDRGDGKYGEAEAPDGLKVEVSPKQDCRVTSWGGWGPCSAKCANLLDMAALPVDRSTRSGNATETMTHVKWPTCLLDTLKLIFGVFKQYIFPDFNFAESGTNH
ncbi:Spondin-1 [Echinococcus granulosus]|uniref:SPONdin extracellular matrix glycoprotein n=1 Tax=Echinococcus granulosus TaxID=6210 RepID=A0A068WV58_ECHGR|nr:Spondin-1 [Echinococcus granulosus]CDS23708.1 SPONdin extracellular matrix glycoprotein [Echinococcus granulosus]